MRIVLRVLPLLLALSLITPLPAQAISNGVGISTNGLLAYWDARNYDSYNGSGTTWSDITGNGNNATIYNAPTHQHISSNSSFAFTGTNSQYMDAGSRTWDFSGGFSLSFYANFGSNANNWERIIDWGIADANSNILVARQGTTSNFWFEVHNSNLTSKGTCTIASGIPVNTYAQWTITVTTGGVCTIYKDNVNQSAVNSGNLLPIAATRTKTYFGRSNWAADDYFEGKIVSVALYNRVLGSSEITGNFNSMIDFAQPVVAPNYLSSPENTTSVTTLTTGETSYYTLLSGGDATAVSVTSGGVLTFNSNPNYEAPVDANTDNQYGFNVRVVDANGNWVETYVQITVTNLVESTTLTAPTLSATAYKGVTVTITVTPSGDGTSIPGKITYLMAGKRIKGCFKKSYTGTGSSTCTFKPFTMGDEEISVTFTPTNTNYTAITAKKNFWIYKRTTTR